MAEQLSSIATSMLQKLQSSSGSQRGTNSTIRRNTIRGLDKVRPDPSKVYVETDKDNMRKPRSNSRKSNSRRSLQDIINGCQEKNGGQLEFALSQTSTQGKSQLDNSNSPNMLLRRPSKRQSSLQRTRSPSFTQRLMSKTMGEHGQAASLQAKQLSFDSMHSRLPSKSATDSNRSGHVPFKEREEDSEHEYDNSFDEDDYDMEDTSEEEDEIMLMTAQQLDEVSYFSQRTANKEFLTTKTRVLHPHGRFRVNWDILLILLITWVLIITPLELSFNDLDVSVRRALLRFDIFVDFFFAVDIILNFNTGVEEDGRLHFSYTSIRQHYVHGWLLADLAWTFPFYAFFEHKDPTIFRAVEPESLFLISHNIPRVQRRLEYSLMITSKISGLISFLYVVVALSHVFSCGFVYLAFGTEDDLAYAVQYGHLEETTMDSRYVAAFYWSIMTMTSVGYGDVAARSSSGRVFSILAMAVGSAVFAYMITSVVALFKQLYEVETENRQKMDQVNAFMHSRSLSRKLRDEVRANFFHLFQATREDKKRHRKIFSKMSTTIQSKIAYNFCMMAMPMKMGYLEGCNAEFIHELYLAMTVRCYLPGEDIIKQDDYGDEMYFLFAGHVQVFVSQTKVAAFGPNSYFGEFGVLNPTKPRQATIQAFDFCETHCTNRSILLSKLMYHPFMLKSIKELGSVKSRKASQFLFGTDIKTNTLLQGLAAVWCAEGLEGLLPPDTKPSDIPGIHRFVRPPTLMRRASNMGRRGSGSLIRSAASLPNVFPAQVAKQSEVQVNPPARPGHQPSSKNLTSDSTARSSRQPSSKALTRDSTATSLPSVRDRFRGQVYDAATAKDETTTVDENSPTRLEKRQSSKRLMAAANKDGGKAESEMTVVVLNRMNEMQKQQQRVDQQLQYLTSLLSQNLPLSSSRETDDRSTQPSTDPVGEANTEEG